eukprot:scaffold5209_cov106-Isochrysis_galbana.AAC.6
MLANKIILVTVDSWEPNHRFPTGHYVRTLGAVGDTNAESEAILIEHEVRTPTQSHWHAPHPLAPAPHTHNRHTHHRHTHNRHRRSLLYMREHMNIGLRLV